MKDRLVNIGLAAAIGFSALGSPKPARAGGCEDFDIEYQKEWASEPFAVERGKYRLEYSRRPNRPQDPSLVTIATKTRFLGIFATEEGIHAAQQDLEGLNCNRSSTIDMQAKFGFFPIRTITGTVFVTTPNCLPTQ